MPALSSQPRRARRLDPQASASPAAAAGAASTATAVGGKAPEGSPTPEAAYPTGPGVGAPGPGLPAPGPAPGPALAHSLGCLNPLYVYGVAHYGCVLLENFLACWSDAGAGWVQCPPALQAVSLAQHSNVLVLSKAVRMLRNGTVCPLPFVSDAGQVIPDCVLHSDGSERCPSLDEGELECAPPTVDGDGDDDDDDHADGDESQGNGTNVTLEYVTRSTVTGHPCALPYVYECVAGGRGFFQCLLCRQVPWPEGAGSLRWLRAHPTHASRPQPLPPTSHLIPSTPPHTSHPSPASPPTNTHTHITTVALQWWNLHGLPGEHGRVCDD